MKKYISIARGEQIETSVTIVCDRCGREYKENSHYIFDGPKHRGRITGLTLLANKTYHLSRKDLCDSCLADILGRLYDEEHVGWLNMEEDHIKEDTDE